MAKIQLGLGLAAGLIGAAAWFQPAVAGSDLWWHLAAGREIVANASVPTTDHFSYTMAGQPWMHHEWLWGVGYWLIYRVAPEGVALGNFALLLAAFGTWLAVAFRHVGDALAASLALWAVAATCTWFLDIRPHELTLLLVGVVLLTRDWPRARWLWPLLMIPWCNLHGGFVFGFGAIGLLALAQTAEESLARGRPRLEPTLWAGVGLTALAFLCNPWGWHILEYPAAYLDAQSPFRQILEWQPPPFDLDPRNFSGRFFWLLALALAGAGLELDGRVRRGRAGGDVYLVALAGVTASMALTSRRFIPLFALCALPLVARLCARLLRALPAQARSAAVAAALLLAIGQWHGVRMFPRPLERWTESHLYPKAALRYVQAIRPGTHVLNYYNWGGYLMLHAPELKVLIDGRANTLYGERLYNDYVAMISGPEGLAGRLALYAPDFALLPPGRSSLAATLSTPDFGWKLIYADDAATILIPPGSPLAHESLPDPDLVLADEPQWLVASAAALLERDDTKGARHRIERALALDPLLASAYGRLADCAAREGDVEGIRTAIARGIAEEPRFTPALRRQEAEAYEAAGKLDLALGAMEQAVPRGPFSRPAGVLGDIDRLRRQVAQR